MRRQNLLAAAGIAVLAGGFQAAANAGATTSGGAKAGAIPATIDSSASPSRVFSASRGGVTFRYRVRGAGPVSVQIRLYRRSGNSLIRTWKRHPKDGGWHTIHWDGSAHGKAQPDGHYVFRLEVRMADGSRVGRASQGNAGRNSFTLHKFIFPVRGSHSYGDGFGAPRAGHIHEGQDVLASCGTPLLAARGGTVKHNAYQSAAGNYIVITMQDTGLDAVYAHLKHPSHHPEGSRVYTGQRIGVVGQTGDATACHLHFELWSSPGWYSGGHPFDPAPYLHAWDRYS